MSTSEESFLDGVSRNSNLSVSDPNFSKFVEDDISVQELLQQTNYEMEEVRSASLSKDNIIKILQEQLSTLHRKHKETIDETELIKFKYNNALGELDSVKKILVQCETEVKNFESKQKDKESVGTTNTVTDPNLQGIAVKIANVQGKVKAVKKIVSDSDMPRKVQEDIDKVDTAYKILLRQQYDRIEDILTEHGCKLDAIKVRVCGLDGRAVTGSKIRFSSPNLNVSEIREKGSSASAVNNTHRPSFDIAKINLIATLRQTNEILEQEIDDLRCQMKFLQTNLRMGAEEFVEDVIESAKLTIHPPETPEQNSNHRSEMAALHDMNNVLRNRNTQLKDEILYLKKQLKDADIKHQSMMILEKETLQESPSYVTNMEQATMKIIIDDLKVEVRNMREELKIKENIIDGLETDVQDLNEKLAELSKQLSNKDQEIDNSLLISSERLGTFKEQIDRISMQKQDTESKLKKIVWEKDIISKNMTVMSNTMQQYKNELEVKQTECAQHKEHMQELEKQIRNFDQRMRDKDKLHEQQMATNKQILSDMEVKYRASREEMEKLRETSQKLITLSGQNQKLTVEVEQLSMELEKFKGFESKDQQQMDKQMHKLQCFCKKLEEKLENAKAEITYEDSKKEIEIKKHLNDKNMLETLTASMRQEMLMQEENSNSLLSDIDSYKDLVRDLTKTIQSMKKELDKYHSGNGSYKLEDLVRENDRLKEEICERNCEIANLRLTLEEYNRCQCPNYKTASCTTQKPSHQQNASEMKQLRKLTDDMKNTQSKITSIINGKQECAHMLERDFNDNKCFHNGRQRINPMCRGGVSSAAADKLNGIKDRVENLNQKEQELHHLLNELQSQNKKLMEFNNKRHRNDAEIENRLAIKHTQDEISRRSCEVFGNVCYPKDEPIKEEISYKITKLEERSDHQTPPSLTNDPVFHSYQNQLEKSVTKYKHAKEDKEEAPKLSSSMKDRTEKSSDRKQFFDPDPIGPTYEEEPAIVSRNDSVTMTRSHLEKRRSIYSDPVKKDLGSGYERKPRVSIKIFDDALLKKMMSMEDPDIDSDEGVDSLQSPIPIYTNELQMKKYENPLHFNVFYSKVPTLMYGQRLENKLAVCAEYHFGAAVVTGGPLGDRPYHFWQMHFHWGLDDDTGGEHTVDDKHFIMEMHAIHIADGTTMEQAVKDPDGFLTVVYFYRYSDDDTDDMAMNSIVQNFQRFDLRPDDDVLEFQSYFPLDLLIRPFETDYVTYRGSRTARSGSDNVIWIMAPFTNKVSAAQMEELRELKSQQVSPWTRRQLQKGKKRPVFLASSDAVDQKNEESIASKNLFLPINVSS